MFLRRKGNTYSAPSLPVYCPSSLFNPPPFPSFIFQIPVPLKFLHHDNPENQKLMPHSGEIMLIE